MRVEEFFRLIEGCLIVFGLSFTAALTDGPFGIFDKIRTKIASTTKKKWIRTGSQCPICLSCWIGIPVAFLLDGGVVMWASALGFTCVVTSLSPDGSEEE
tara:strand:+ start:1016 stop:1315 length:300 start_codon:yes stop_codon:yes gene_type:complete